MKLFAILALVGLIGCGSNPVVNDVGEYKKGAYSEPLDIDPTYDTIILNDLPGNRPAKYPNTTGSNGGSTPD